MPQVAPTRCRTRPQRSGVLCFTLSAPTAAQLLEPAAPSFEARLEAARRCADAGYPVRFRFSPIVPFRGWRDELRTMVARMAERVRPELVTLWTLSMVDGAELEHIVDPDALDPAFLQATVDHREELAGAKGAPFPEPMRLALYETVANAIAHHSPETRVALCLETPAVIDRLRPRLAMTKRAQVCNCGPRCTSAQLQGAPAVRDPSERQALRRRETAPRVRSDRASTRRTRRG